MITLEEHLRKLENLYRVGPFNQAFRPEVTLREGEATVAFAVTPEHFHGGGFLHGAVCFKVLDDAAFFAASSVERETFVVTSGFTLHFTRPVGAGLLRATATVVQRSRSLILVDVVAQDAADRPVARGTASFMPTRQAFASLPGYASG